MTMEAAQPNSGIEPEAQPEISAEQTSQETESVEICPAIEIDGLTKNYGTNKALDHISFSVKKGEIMGFLGPNGAGKSTTMNILTGYLAPSSGKVRIDGTDISENPAETRRKIGYLPEFPPLYTDMTVKEYLNFVYDLKGIKKADKGAHLRKVMEKVRVTEVKGRLIRNLSKGYKQRVGLAQALIGDPEVLVLDEPTVGLDPKQILEIREVISELGKNRTVILSTHILQEVSAVCDSYTIINHGKIVASGRMDELDQEAGSERYLLKIKGTVEDAYRILEGIDGLQSAEDAGCTEEGTVDVLVTALPQTDIREAIFQKFAQSGKALLAFESATPTLEELFMQIISADDTQAEEKESEMDETDLQMPGGGSIPEMESVSEAGDVKTEQDYQEEEAAEE
ncbi:ABC transporter ATP-binding protein [Ructibacterium gallinarum]|nr:ATP-binding cassette domain-containing protein [Ructibacterium gallinarum]